MATVCQKQKIEDFQNKCYESYKLDWMLSHGYTLTDLFYITTSLASEQVAEGETPITSDDTELFAWNVKDRFLSDTGFGSGSLYVCQDEFLTHEFLDPDYMRHLFGLMPNGEELEMFYTDLMSSETDSESSTNAELTPDGNDYYVTFRIDGRYVAKVTSLDLEKAKEDAVFEYYDADFGTLECVESEIILVEDENGNYLYER